MNYNQKFWKWCHC